MKPLFFQGKYSFQGLFTLLVFSLIINAFFAGFEFINYLSSLIFTFILLAAVYATSKSKLQFIILAALAVLTIATTWYDINSRDTFAKLLDHGLNVFFFGYLIYVLGHRIFSAEEITADTIFGTLCLYMIIAYFWAFGYVILDILNPNSFDMGPHSHDPRSYIYYSFITLSTLGYGDIVPLTPQSQVMAIFETVMGQFFIAVVVARYVGILVAKKLTHENEK